MLILTPSITQDTKTFFFFLIIINCNAGVMNPLRRVSFQSTQQHFAAQLPLSQRVLSGF